MTDAWLCNTLQALYEQDYTLLLHILDLPTCAFQTLVNYSTSIQVNLVMDYTIQAEYKSAILEVQVSQFEIPQQSNKVLGVAEQLW